MLISVIPLLLLASWFPLLKIGIIMPSPPTRGYSPFLNNLLNSFKMNGDIISNDILNISAFKLSMSALYFSGEKMLVFIQFPLFQNPILGQILSEV